MFPFKSSEFRCWMFANHSMWYSTTARPHGRYKPRSAPNKLVDFCVYANMDDDDQLMTAQRALCRQTPTLSVNHTDFDPLQTRPIMFSIETKKTGEHLTKAQLQVGVWHAAQWSFLESTCMVASRQFSTEQDEPDMNFTEQNSTTATHSHNSEQNILGKLSFLPGIIVQGHEWSLVLSTRENGKTVLWTKKQFGSTESELGCYQIVAGIRELLRWAECEYLPWFKETILSRYISWTLLLREM